MQRISGQGVQVFFTAFAFFFIETAFFHILHFTHDNLEATLVISYALLGLSLGSLVTYLAFRIKAINFPLLVLLFILSTVLAFLNITRAPRFVHMSPFMIFPFMMATSSSPTSSAQRIRTACTSTTCWARPAVYSSPWQPSPC